MKFRQLLLFVALLGVTVPTTLAFSKEQLSNAGGQIFKLARS
jgi:hypothetical protein